MCGIVGLASLYPYDRTSDLVQMRDSLIHRGPDTCGTWWSDCRRIGFGHRRLAILDLTSAGHQPMTTKDGDYTIVFNGEIYNHAELRRELTTRGNTFRSCSDTEVLLQGYRAFGIEIIRRLSGMFALAIYDKNKQILFLARDRAGEKPLYWSTSNGVFSFASELKGLLRRPGHSRVLSATGLDEYLAYGSVGGDRCMIAGVSKLPPGHLLSYAIESGTFSVLPYWQIPKAQEQARVDENALVDELGQLLKNSVAQKLVADVPVGVLLSGGLDSSIVTAIAATSSPKPIRTFTVGFPGNDRFDERKYAQRISSYFGTIHEELDAESCDINLIDDLAFYFDEPLCDSSILPTYLVAKLVRSRCTVALGGDGGDELFGGYFAYQRIMRMQHWRAITPRLVRRGIATMAKACICDMSAAQNGIAAFAKKLDDISDLGLLFPKSVRQRLCGRRISGDSELRMDPLELSRGMPGACMIHDFRHNLPNDLLVKIDRATMAHSLEMRAPFLDPDIIEFAYTKVPNHLRATRKERKILLRKLARKLLPEDHDLYRKQGFWAPIASWMSDKAMYRKIIDRLLDNILFDGPTIRSLFPAVADRRMAERLFALVMLDAWMRRHGISAV